MEDQGAVSCGQLVDLDEDPVFPLVRRAGERFAAGCSRGNDGDRSCGDGREGGAHGAAPSTGDAVAELR